MKKLKIQFLLFFLLLAIALGALIFNSYRQMALEERTVWADLCEKVYNQFQASLSDFLTQEDGRSFSEYRYFQALPGVGKETVALSPLSVLPAKDDERGIIGYFQIEPDGSLSTPYLPEKTVALPLADLERRREKKEKLEKLLRPLRSEALFRKSEDSFQDLPVTTSNQNVYPKSVSGPLGPKPILEEKSASKKNKKGREKDSGLPDLASSEDEKQQALQGEISRRQLNPSYAQLYTFAKPEALKEESTSEARKSPSQKRMLARSPQKLAKREGSALKREILGKLGDIFQQPPSQRKTPTILIDPFQVRLLNAQTLVFYRKLWLDQKLYVQGFAVDLNRFYRSLMEASFANSNLTSFSQASLEQNNKPLTVYRHNAAIAPSKILFERQLAFPMHEFEWSVQAGNLPRSPIRFYFHLFVGLLIALSTAGLYFIYRSVSAKVLLSEKRQDFVAAVSHELKTPLTSIRMYSEMLEAGWVNEGERQREYAQRISQESGRLSRLIENVLQLARLEKRGYPLALKMDLVQKDLEKFIPELERIAQSKGYAIAHAISQEVPALQYDPEALKQILCIFLENSLKFCELKRSGEAQDSSLKRFELVFKKNERGAVLEWRDYGPGVPVQELEKIFDQFYRVENEMTRKTTGTGIGLAMARRLAEAMRAAIEAENAKEAGLILRVQWNLGSA